MKPFNEFVRKYRTLILIPLWVGFLAFPFVIAEQVYHPTGSVSRATIIWNVVADGIHGSTWIALGTLGVLVLWKVIRTDTFLGSIRAAVKHLPVRKPAVSRISLSLRNPAVLIALLLFFIIVPFFQNDYYRDIMTLTGMYIVLALGLNIVVGQTGLLNLGYAAFYAVGAYTYAILSTSFGLPFWPGLAVGALAAAAFAAVIGVATLNLRGDYFAIVTLGLGEITRIVLNNWDAVTGGPNGISNIGRPSIAGYTLHTTLDFYYLILFMVILTIFAMSRLLSSRIGRAWIAIREDEIAAEAMGINTFRLKLLAFVLGSAWAGLVGVFFASKMAFVSPESFTFFESVLVLCMVVLGGMGSIPGIILGAFLLITLPEVFRDLQDYRMLAFGLALVLMMIFRPQGLLGTVKNNSV